MADCKKTVDFLRTLKRYCHGRRCSDCALCPKIDGEAARESCISMVGDIGLAYAETIIPPLQRWADAHPAETWQQRLKRLLPECNLASVVRGSCPGEFFVAAPGRDDCQYDKREPPAVRCPGCWGQEAVDEL